MPAAHPAVILRLSGLLPVWHQCPNRFRSGYRAGLTIVTRSGSREKTVGTSKGAGWAESRSFLRYFRGIYLIGIHTRGQAVGIYSGTGAIIVVIFQNSCHCGKGRSRDLPI